MQQCNMESDVNNNFHEDNDELNATLGLKILQIFMTHHPERCEHRWYLPDSHEECKFLERIIRTPQELYRDLDTGKYMRYSSLMIIVDRLELYDRSDVKLLVEHIEHNHYLCNTPILMIYEYGIDKDIANLTEVIDNYMQRLQDKYPSKIELQTSTFLYPNNFGLPMVMWDDRYVKTRKLENIMLMQVFVDYEWYHYANFMLTCLSEREVTILKVFNLADAEFEYLLTIGEDTLYFFNLNPTLAIVINNYYFTSPFSVREGSEHDVVHLIREFKLDRMPYIIIEDSDRSKLLAILKYLQKTNFKSLKRLMIFVMSHGGENNTIFTHDGRLNGNVDIVQRLLSNKTLQSVQTSLLFVHCRGDIDIDMEELTPDLLSRIKPMNNKHLPSNTSLIYSCPSAMVSYRWPNIGTPAILSFCKNYRQMSTTNTMTFLWRKMEKDIKKIQLFSELRHCTEMVGSADKYPQHVKTLRVAAREMYNLLEDIMCNFPAFSGTQILSGGLFNILSFFNELKVPKKTKIIDLYKSPDLDEGKSKADDVIPKLRELQG